MKIRKLQSSEVPPMDLLLEADPSEYKIDSYLNKGSSFVAEADNHIIGIYVIVKISKETAEIINISIRETHQGKGLGKKLIHHAKEQARALGFAFLEVGTGNSSINQIAFYQKCGFRMIKIDQDYFLQHYDEPIYEHGIQCLDMIRFSFIL